MPSRIVRRDSSVRTIVLAASFACGVLNRANAQEGAGSRVSGLVFDSVAHRAVAGAVVRFVLARDPALGRSAVSDSAGRYSVLGLTEGTWLATFLHPVIDSLGLEPEVKRVEVSAETPMVVSFATPSPRSLTGALCGALPADANGVLTGTVRQAGSGEVVAGATVAVEWPEWVVAKGGRWTEMLRRESVADTHGRYAACGVPSDVTVRVIATRGADSTGLVAVDVPLSGFARQDFFVPPAASVRLLDRAASAVDTNEAVRLGRAAVRGVVRDARGAPAAGAVVRILGSGIPVRSRDDGSFSLADIVSGTQTLEVRALGAPPLRRTLQLTDDLVSDVTVALAGRTALKLDTVRIVTTPPSAELRAVERRARAGRGGVFMTGRQVRDNAPIFLSDAFRGLVGVRVVPVAGYGQLLLMRGMGGRECAPAQFVDGVRLRGSTSGRGAELFLDDLVDKSEVAAVEVYPRSAGAPAEFMDLDGCGVVVVWTRGRLGGMEPNLRTGR